MSDTPQNTEPAVKEEPVAAEEQAAAEEPAESDEKDGLEDTPAPEANEIVAAEDDTPNDDDTLKDDDTPDDPLGRGQRTKKLTEKGEGWEIDRTLHHLRSALSSWRKQATKVEGMIDDCIEPEFLRAARNQLGTAMDCVHKAFDAYEIRNIVDEETRQKIETIEVENLDIVKRTGTRLREIDDDRSSGNFNRKSRKSSVISNITTHSNVDSLKLKLKHSRLEELKQQELIRVKAELGRIRLQKELDLAEAAMNERRRPSEEATRKLVDQHNPDQIVSSKSVVTPKNAKSHPRVTCPEVVVDRAPGIAAGNIPPSSCSTRAGNVEKVVTVAEVHTMPDVPPQITPRRLVESISDTVKGSHTHSSCDDPVATSFMQQLMASRLPVPEPECFDGDPLRYTGWKSAFTALISHHNIPNVEKLYYLKKYVAGQARECIEGCFLINSPDSFSQAFDMLDERFGDAFTLASAFRDKIDSWPKILGNDAKLLRKFADFLRQCLFAKESIAGLAVLDDDRENRKMLQKLPSWMINRWTREVVRYKENEGQFPPFQKFVSFVVREAKIACDPVASLQSLSQQQKVKTSAEKQTRSRNSTTFLNSTSPQKDEKGHQQGPKSSANFTSHVASCPCKEHQDLDLCQAYLSMPLEERQNYVKGNGFCFKCLKSGHMARKCEEKKTCQVCGKTHPTSLHRYEVDHTQSDGMVMARSNAVTQKDTPSGDKASLIVPLWICHNTNPSHEVPVYALLDSQSDTCFITESTVTALGAPAHSTKLCISTMSDSCKVVDTERVAGLKIRGFSNSVEITLPTTYTRTQIPANRSHIPTPEMASKWSHLKVLEDKLSPLQDIEIGLLIGYNCSKALLPREVIPPANDGPYGQRTDLGWGIVGVCSRSTAEIDTFGISHRVLSCLPPPETAIFSQQQTTKELFSDLHDENAEDVRLSIEDNKFQMSPKIHTDLDFPIDEEIFQTDSQVPDSPAEGPEVKVVDDRQCRRLYAGTETQRMADLPTDQLGWDQIAPFSQCGVDYFGPWVVKEGRRDVKRWGVIFTCLNSRAVHVELANSLTTDSFLNALRRFMSIRGPINLLRCDRGTNFVGAKAELDKAVDEMDHAKIEDHLLQRSCSYVLFKMNCPSASHAGGVWERQIRSIRRVLNSLLLEFGDQLDDESLRTLLCEAAAIVNSRPLSPENLADVSSLAPITPMQLLTMKTQVLLPPPGNFQREDVYSRKRWRRVQYLLNQFWFRWRREYLQNLQSRQKWNGLRRDMKVGDVVLIKDENLHRSEWCLGRVAHVYPSEDGHVRSARVRVGNQNLSSQGKAKQEASYLDRPVQKLVLLVSDETEDSQTGSHYDVKELES